MVPGPGALVISLPRYLFSFFFCLFLGAHSSGETHQGFAVIVIEDSFFFPPFLRGVAVLPNNNNKKKKIHLS